MSNSIEQLQSIVNAFAAHLRKQLCRSVEGDDCMYRGVDGTSCGIGGLIANEHYTPMIEMRPAHHYRVRQALTASGYPNDDVEATTLRALQTCHDEASDDDFLTSFEHRLQHFCETFGVEYPQSA